MDCFGDSSSDEEEGNESSIRRDESCGVCCFHSNTETSLLTHVRNSLRTTTATASTSSPIGNGTKLQRSSEVLKAIDSFCMSRHWMMHVGPEKGEILLGALNDAIDNKIKIQQSSPSESHTSFVAVELGSYCGYASILMGQAFCKKKSEDINCHLYTAEINREYAEIASEHIKLCGMEDIVSVHQISFDGHDTDMVKVIDNALKQNKCQVKKIDFLFIDHDKDAYKSDLCKLEASGMIQAGTKVVADNVLFANIYDYVSYVQEQEKMGIVETRTVSCHVEYSGDGTDSGKESHPIEDGVEITDYLRNP